MIGTSIVQAKMLLEQAKVVAIPTETVYGLAGNALDKAAVAQIFHIKNRPFFDPLIVHTHSLAGIDELVQEFPVAARRLAEQTMPGAVTLLLPKRSHIPDLVTSGLPNVAVRIPNHPLTLALLSSLSFPLAAPSANPFGYISPTTAQHVADQLGDRLPYILDGGACSIGIESTIVGFPNQQATIYRMGGMTIELLEDLLQQKIVLAPQQSNSPQTAGQLDQHYSPTAPMLLGNIEQLINTHSDRQRIGVLSFQNPYLHLPNVVERFILSPDGDMIIAAQHLFAAMRYLDAQHLDLIIAEPLPEIGLGRAINDRLRRAAAKATHFPPL
ncbi:MAG: threonylcarbamoyl-AMP synthase [Chitinophagales bacterium]|nr:threonylcarbamoyl-AMP synthase [Chitinophagales bacterium]